MRRRGNDPWWQEIFQGQGIDIGSGGDGLSKHGLDCRDFDVGDGDAQLMESVPDNTYDWVHSSHCLEHMRDAKEALHNWYRILKPGGYLIVVVPDWELYEGKQWPSRFNNDHKQRFSLTVKDVTDPRDCLPEGAEIVIARRLGQTMPDWRTEGYDYSCLKDTEPAIEMLVRKPNTVPDEEKVGAISIA